MTELSLAVAVLAVALLAVLMLVAAILRHHLRPLRSLAVPNSVTAGALALLLGPQVLGWPFDRGPLDAGAFGGEIVAVWSELPGILINVVFAAVLLGTAIPDVRTLARRSAPPALFGAAVAFGQYLVGLLLALFVLVPAFGLSILSGSLLEMSFTGGHGTVAGMSQVMDDLGFVQGRDLGLGLATVGLLSGIGIGTVLVNRAVRSGRLTTSTPAAGTRGGGARSVTGQVAPAGPDHDLASSPLTVTVGVIALAIALGWLLQQLLIGATLLGGRGSAHETFARQLPLFPFTIVGGAVLQAVIIARGWSHLVPRAFVNHAAGFALDLLVVASIATLSISTLGDNLIPFLLMAAAALGWTVIAILLLAPRVYGAGWFERAIGDLGQASGSVASGLLLLRMADPHDTSGAHEGFGYKQILFEPMLGGGIVTSFALPLVHRLGAGPMAVGAAACTVATLAIGARLARMSPAAPGSP